MSKIPRVLPGRYSRGATELTWWGSSPNRAGSRNVESKLYIFKSIQINFTSRLEKAVARTMLTIRNPETLGDLARATSASGGARHWHTPGRGAQAKDIRKRLFEISDKCDIFVVRPGDREQG
jgi:hypothetical protein